MWLKRGKNWLKSGKIDESGSNSGKSFGEFLIGLFTLAQSDIRTVPFPKIEHPKKFLNIPQKFIPQINVFF